MGVNGEVGANLKFTQSWDFAGFKYGKGMGTWLRVGMCVFVVSPSPWGSWGKWGKFEICKKLGFCWFQVWEGYGNMVKGWGVCFGCLPSPMGVKGVVAEKLKFTKSWDFAGCKYGKEHG